MAKITRSSIFVALLSVIVLGLCGSLWAQDFYDDDGVPQYEAPPTDDDEEDDDSDRAEEDRHGVPTYDESPPRTRDEARSREQRQRDDQYDWGDSPRRDELSPGVIPYSDPYDLRVMNYQFWLGSSSMLLGQLAVGMAFSMVAYPLLFATGGSPQGEIALAVVALGMYLVPPTVIAPWVINWTGNRYYPDQHLGAYLGSAAGLGLAIAVNIGFVMADMRAGPGVDYMYPWGMVLTAVMAMGAPAAGGVLGYHIQANSRANQRRDQAPMVELTPAPFVSTDNGQKNFGLGLHGRF